MSRQAAPIPGKSGDIVAGYDASRPVAVGNLDGVRGGGRGQARCVCMTRKLAEWPFENGQTENAGPSDGCRGNVVPLAIESNYDLREPGANLENVG